MALKTIGGVMLRDMLYNGAALLTQNKQAIDALNVFPVPDGDTGTNMSMTINSALKELTGPALKDCESVAQAVATGSLRSARGNSGVILSQLYRGFFRGVREHAELDAKSFAQALIFGSEDAYKAVMKPKEGTMLTVAKAFAQEAMNQAKQGADFETMLSAAIAVGKDTLKKTPDMLPVLKEAGVVDAGGYGILCIYDGYMLALSGQKIEAAVSDAEPSEPHFAGMEVHGDIEFAYCTEFIIENIKPGIDMQKVDAFRQTLDEMGDSVLVVGDVVLDGLIKVHVHTNDPGQAMHLACALGELDSIKVDNMRKQHRHLTVTEADELMEPEKDETVDMGIVSVVAGEGLENIMRDLGSTAVVTGGQTMNPSIEDIVKAVGKVKAHDVYVLPNNKNIILAAQQAAELTEDKKVHVIPTRSIAQGINALLAFHPEMNAEENLGRMNSAIDSAHCAQVTYAIRPSKYNGHKIKVGDVLGIYDGDIVKVGKNLMDTARELVLEKATEDSEVITIFYGEGMEKEQAEELQSTLIEEYAQCDVEVEWGGQPVYPLIICIE